MFRLFPCLPIFKGAFLLKVQKKKMCICDYVKNRIGTCQKCIFWCGKGYKWIWCSFSCALLEPTSPPSHLFQGEWGLQKLVKKWGCEIFYKTEETGKKGDSVKHGMPNFFTVLLKAGMRFPKISKKGGLRFSI